MSFRRTIPKILTQLRLHCPGMYADGHSRSLRLFQMEVEGAHCLVQRGFGSAVGVPSAFPVVPNRTYSGGDVDPFGQGFVGEGARHRSRREETDEVFHKEEVGEYVDAEGFLYSG